MRYKEFQSTHPRRMWRPSLTGLKGDKLFQSTHPRRMWHYLIFRSLTIFRFNPHTHEGCDNKIIIEFTQINLFQSTHPRRMWLMTTVGAAYKMLFQSTHPRRMWLVQLSSLCAALRFNPHTHEGCDRWVHVLNPGERSFNPHTHEGCDTTTKVTDGHMQVSIHTPTKDVTF